MDTTRNECRGAVPSAEEDLAKAAGFHGHVCPGLAYGVRVARAARGLLGIDSARDEEIVAIAETDSCMVDAVQALLGCTFGKGNLVFRDTGKAVFTFFRRNGNRTGFRISVEPDREETEEAGEAWGRYRRGERDPELMARIEELKQEKIARIMNNAEDEMLRVAEVEEPVPSPAKIFPSVRCSGCGEKVMEPRARLAGGRVYCFPCFEKI